MKKKSYSVQEKRTLYHMAALCYLRYRTLSPMVTLNEGSNFHTTLKPSIPAIEEAIKNGHKDPAYQKALTLLKPLLIKPSQLAAFLNHWQLLKESYTKQCKSFSLTKSSLVIPPVFDPEEQLSKELIKQRNKLNKICAYPQHSSQIYYALLQTLCQKIDFTPKNLKQALKLIIPGKSVDQLLKELN